MDPIVTDDERVSELRATVAEAVKRMDIRFGIHDFRFVEGDTHSNLIFDVTVPFEIKESDEDIKKRIDAAIKAIDPTYFTVLTVDRE